MRTRQRNKQPNGSPSIGIIEHMTCVMERRLGVPYWRRYKGLFFSSGPYHTSSPPFNETWICLGFLPSSFSLFDFISVLLRHIGAWCWALQISLLAIAALFQFLFC